MLDIYIHEFKNKYSLYFRSFSKIEPKLHGMVRRFKVLSESEVGPAVRRTQPITKKAKISSTTHIHCYNG